MRSVPLSRGHVNTAGVYVLLGCVWGSGIPHPYTRLCLLSVFSINQCICTYSVAYLNSDPDVFQSQSLLFSSSFTCTHAVSASYLFQHI